MPHPRARVSNAFYVALAITAVLCLAPTRWLGWVSDVAFIVRLPVAPLGDLGNSLARWLRPPATSHEQLPPQARELVQNLEQDRDRFERLYHAAAQRAAELEEQLQQLQLVPVETLNTPVSLLRAQITNRAPADVESPVQLNRGSRHGVAPGSIAVYNGVHLIGRVADVSPVSASLHPITNPATGLLRASVFPGGGGEGATVHDAGRVALRPLGDGTFMGDVARQHPVQAGDVVRLFDPKWPTSAQAMIIGTVTDVRTKDDQPLRRIVIVQPRFRVSDLSDVTLIIEDRRAAAGGTD